MSAVSQSKKSKGDSQLDFEFGTPEIKKEEIIYIEKIGEGCFGSVWSGKCRGKEVAVKKLFQQDMSEACLNSFKKEVEFCSAIHHPNVVLFMGACTDSGDMAIVTELMPKGNLEDALRDTSLNLSLYRRLTMAKDAALGINWLHCSNPQIIHRDLKPSNLLLDKSGNVKVCDFGLSSARPNMEKIQDKDSIPGTPLWMAPEVMLGQPLDEKADVYSFGICLWEIVTRQEPFPDMQSYTVFRHAITVKNLRPEIPKDTLPSLKQLMERCWNKNSAARPSFGEIINELDTCIIEAAVSDPIGRQIWMSHFFGKDKVLWKNFALGFQKTLKYTTFVNIETDLDFLCLKEILAIKDSDPTLKDPPDVVFLERFGIMLDFFGPIDSNGSAFIARIKNVLKQPWFHGEVSRQQAESFLAKGNKKGSFLIRLSTTSAGCFTISKVSKSGSINHQRIDYKPGKGFSLSISTKKGKKQFKENSTLNSFIDLIKSELYLKAPVTPSPYEHLFAKSKAKLDGYLPCDSDDDDD